MHLFRYIILHLVCMSFAYANHPTPEKLSPDESLHQAAVNYFDNSPKTLLHKAEIALRLQDYSLAEKLQLQALNLDMSKESRRELLLNMATTYQHLKIPSKMASIYEKFIELYPKDPDIPTIYLNLGRLYRDIGAYEIAIERFYTILNLSLGAKAKNIDEFKIMVLEAQSQIADIYFELQKFDQAKTFYNRLDRIELSAEQKEYVLFQLAMCSFKLDQLSIALSQLQIFISQHPESKFIPECHYLTAYIYQKLNKPEDAIRAIRTLLDTNNQNNMKDPELWLYWKKKTTNQIANEFYQDNDYISALKVYQAMLHLDTSTEWQWPILYQSALCFEKLLMYPKAEEAYSSIIKAQSQAPTNQPPYLQDIYDMAQWRKINLESILNSETKLQKLLAPSNPITQNQ